MSTKANPMFPVDYGDSSFSAWFNDEHGIPISRNKTRWENFRNSHPEVYEYAIRFAARYRYLQFGRDFGDAFTSSGDIIQRCARETNKGNISQEEHNLAMIMLIRCWMWGRDLYQAIRTSNVPLLNHEKLTQS